MIEYHAPLSMLIDWIAFTEIEIEQEMSAWSDIWNLCPSKHTPPFILSPEGNVYCNFDH